jgi:hypothetical protein
MKEKILAIIEKRYGSYTRRIVAAQLNENGELVAEFKRYKIIKNTAVEECGLRWYKFKDDFLEEMKRIAKENGIEIKIV